MCVVLQHCWSCSSIQLLQSVIYLSRCCQFCCCFYLQTIGNQWHVSTPFVDSTDCLVCKSCFCVSALEPDGPCCLRCLGLDFLRHFRSNLPVSEHPFLHNIIIFTNNFFIIFFCSGRELICTKTAVLTDCLI